LIFGAWIMNSSPMLLSNEDKQSIAGELVSCLSCQPEVRKLLIFGSFVTGSDPGDLDVAVFQDSNEGYLPLAMRYRRLTRALAQRIPLDIIPIRVAPPLSLSSTSSAFLSELNRGQVIYER